MPNIPSLNSSNSFPPFPERFHDCFDVSDFGATDLDSIELELSARHARGRLGALSLLNFDPSLGHRFCRNLPGLSLNKTLLLPDRWSLLHSSSVLCKLYKVCDHLTSWRLGPTASSPGHPTGAALQNPKQPKHQDCSAMTRIPVALMMRPQTARLALEISSLTISQGSRGGAPHLYVATVHQFETRKHSY